MCKFCWALSGVLFLSIAAMAYVFVVRGAVSPGDDGRTAIHMPASERDIVLVEMRGFLESVQEILAGVSEKDMNAVAEAAQKSGKAATKGIPVSLMGRLPLAFKQMGMATHKGFDALALEAKEIGDGQLILRKLSDLMVNCTSCHAGYKIETSGKK